MRMRANGGLPAGMAISTRIPDANYENVHVIDIAAPAEQVWRAIPELIRRMTRIEPVNALLAIPLLVATAMRRDGLTGEPLRWVTPTAGREIVVSGRHRYADFAANLYLEPMPGRTRVYNVSRAHFRLGGLGRLYRLGVGLFHDVYIERILGQLKEAVK